MADAQVCTWPSPFSQFESESVSDKPSVTAKYPSLSGFRHQRKALRDHDMKVFGEGCGEALFAKGASPETLPETHEF